MSIQEKVLADIISVIEDNGFEAVTCPNWANTGRISIQQKGEIGEHGSVSYDFQNAWGNMTFSIAIQSKKVLSQPPRLGYFDFYMDYSSADSYRNFRKVLFSSLTELALKLATSSKRKSV
jgi:hypothetical protein